MKKLNLITFLVVLVIGLTGCKQDDIFNAAEQAEIDEATIVSYLKSVDYYEEAIRDDASGIYYVIFEQGTGIKPAFGATVITHYSGYFLSGELFDTSLDSPGPIDFVLGRGDVIAGWDRGFSLIEKGTRALLIIPSGLAYGNNGNAGIPPNEVLQFEVNLIDVR
jgi:FKBP-type peptidyl-prolyl cis-trans isomerase FkpA